MYQNFANGLRSAVLEAFKNRFDRPRPRILRLETANVVTEDYELQNDLLRHFGIQGTQVAEDIMVAVQEARMKPETRKARTSQSN